MPSPVSRTFFADCATKEKETVGPAARNHQGTSFLIDRGKELTAFIAGNVFATTRS